MVVLIAALIGAGAGLLVALWAAIGEQDPLAFAFAQFWGPAIGGLFGLAIGWAIAVVSSRSPSR